MSGYKTQYNNNYQKKSYNNNGSDSNGGTARITSTKKSGCILEVNLNNQNLVLKGFWDNRVNGWKLFPYYDKTKTNPAFNKPKQSYQQGNDMDDQLPQSEKEWGKSDFNPDEYEQQLSQNDYK
jgi:hypothetical protein